MMESLNVVALRPADNKEHVLRTVFIWMYWHVGVFKHAMPHFILSKGIALTLISIAWKTCPSLTTNDPVLWTRATSSFTVQVPILISEILMTIRTTFIAFFLKYY